jgi:NAD dependent epimerase/dehydratase family enzyme
LPAIPAFVIKTLFGDMAGMVLEGSRVSNEKIRACGFQFQYDDIDQALEDLLK